MTDSAPRPNPDATVCRMFSCSPGGERRGAPAALRPDPLSLARLNAPRRRGLLLIDPAPLPCCYCDFQCKRYPEPLQYIFRYNGQRN